MRKEILGASRVLMYLFIHSFFFVGVFVFIYVPVCFAWRLSFSLSFSRFSFCRHMYSPSLSPSACLSYFPFPNFSFLLSPSFSSLLPLSPLPPLLFFSAFLHFFFFLPPFFLSLLLPLILLSPSPSSSLRTNRVSKRDNGNY